MFAVSITAGVRHGMMEQTWRFWNEQVLFDKRHVPGFREAVVLLGQDHRSIREISLWESREHADAILGNRWRPEVSRAFDYLLTGPPVVECFDAISVGPLMGTGPFTGVM